MSFDNERRQKMADDDVKRTGPKPKLGDLLLRDNVISLQTLDRAKKIAVDQKIKLITAITRMGGVAASRMVEYLAEASGLPAISVADLQISEKDRAIITREIIVRHQMVPIEINHDKKTIVMAFADPDKIPSAMDDIKFTIGYKIDPVLASEDEIQSVIDHWYKEDTVTELANILDQEQVKLRVGEQNDNDVSQLEKEAGQPDIIRLVNAILTDGIKRSASDIHIETFEDSFRVRYRLDGVLQEIIRPSYKLKNAVTSRIKIMSNLKLDEKRLPQDGRIQLELTNGRKVDFRVSVLPCTYGENIVLRILEQTALQMDMTKLGFDEDQLTVFKEAVFSPWGMVLITGPTGSGKTTTLYSALMALNTNERKLLTAEDPVEITMAGVNQVQINEAIGFKFSDVLRAFLRQDPDVIMVGEIRDFETAEIAIKAAMTGHLVLSTLHTNDAPSTVSRLTQMGIEPFLLTSAVNLIAAQRLIRKLCNSCKVQTEIPLESLIELGLLEEVAKSAVTFKGAGCHACNGTGYKGRLAIYEVMPLDDSLKENIIQGFSAMELTKEARRLGMRSLRDSGVKKMLNGLTSYEEIRRVTRK
ncbi:MAG: type IV-A pilus assembly ATPase PilB [Patescibacteria group bacterium]